MALLAPSCNVKKHLAEDEQLIWKNEVVIHGQVPNKELQRNIQRNLETRANPKPNDKSFFFFKTKLWYHYRLAEKKDTSSFDKFIRNNIAEPPSLNDSLVILQSAENMKRYLFSEGFLQAYVEHQTEDRNKGAKVIYNAYTGKRFYIRDNRLNCEDTVVQAFLDKTQEESFLKTGDPFNEFTWNAERQRIVNLMQNAGYANFSYNHMSERPLITDTLAGTVVFQWSIFRPDSTQSHARKTIGSVEVSYNPAINVQPIVESIDSITFLDYSNSRPPIRNEALLRYIYLRPGELYRKDNESLSRRLLNLSAFRNVQLEKINHPTDPNIIDYSIVIRPVKKIDFNSDVEINNNTRNIIRTDKNTFLGTSFNTIVTDNNFLGGFERFSNGITFNVEFGRGSDTLSSNSLINSLSFIYSSDLSLPRFTDYFGLYRIFNNTNIASDNFFDNMYQSANTLMNVKFERVGLRNWYNYNQLQLSYGFSNSYTKSNKSISYNIKNLQFTYFDATLRNRFRRTFGENSFNFRSFQDQLFSALIFSGIDYQVERPRISSLLGSRFKYSFESSGAEVALIEAFRGGDQKGLQLFGLPFAKYVKGDVDASLYLNFSESSTLVFRGSVGIASPYGNSKDVPYIKQFFLGGANTIRAWRVREVGPGALVDSAAIIDPNSLDLLSKTGDFKLLFNAEYRFDIFWQINGAIFLDAGNVWNLKNSEENQNRPPTPDVLSGAFLNQMAVGSGLGLRIDLTYFNFVVDLGVKLRYPYPLANGSNWIFNNNLSNRDLLNINLLINYPF